VSFFEVSKILFVTDSGAGPPLARLYLIPKSFLGPIQLPLAGSLMRGWAARTSSVVTGSQKNTTSSLAFPNDMGSCRSTQDASLTDQQLLDTVCSSNFGNQLHNLWVPVSSITTNNQEAILDSFWDREEDAGHKGLAIVRLLEDDDLLPQTRAVHLLFLNFSTLVGGEMRGKRTFLASGR